MPETDQKLAVSTKAVIEGCELWKRATDDLLSQYKKQPDEVRENDLRLHKLTFFTGPATIMLAAEVTKKEKGDTAPIHISVQEATMMANFFYQGMQILPAGGDARLELIRYQAYFRDKVTAANLTDAAEAMPRKFLWLIALLSLAVALYSMA